MKRKDIRRVLKKWVYREKTDVFESLVDEVYNMIQEEKNEKKDKS